MSYQEILSSHSDAFTQSDIIFDCLRPIGWMIIRFFAALCDMMQSVFDAAYTMLNVLTSQPFLDFADEFKPAIIIVLSGSLIVLGFIYTFSDKKPPIVKNALIGLAIIFMMPEVITMMNDGIISTKDELVTNSYATETVLSNVTDLKVVAGNGFDFTSSLADTLTGTSSLSAISSAEHIKASQVSDDLAKQVFGHYRTIDESGNLSWEETGTKGLFEIFDPPYYYRYSIHFFEIILILIGNMLIFIFSSYAVVRMEYEIITTKIVATVASMELSSGQKTWKTLEYFFNGYIVLFAIPVLLKIYLICQQYINGTFDNGLVRAFLIFICALVVMDGPSTIEKLFGYDMGMSQGAMKFMSFVRMMQQARMQHNMSNHQDSSNKGLSDQKQQSRNTATQRANSNNNASGGAIAEPQINGSDSNSNKSVAGSEYGQQSGSTEPNINAGNVGNGSASNGNVSNGSASTGSENGLNSQPGNLSEGISMSESNEPEINSPIESSKNDYNNTSSNIKEPNISSGGMTSGSRNSNQNSINASGGSKEPGITAGITSIGGGNQNSINNANSPLDSKSENGINGQYSSAVEPQISSASNQESGSSMNTGNESNPSSVYDSNSLNGSSNAEPDISGGTSGAGSQSYNNGSTISNGDSDGKLSQKNVEPGNFGSGNQGLKENGNISGNNMNGPQVNAAQATSELKSDGKNTVTDSAAKLNKVSDLNSNNGSGRTNSSNIPSGSDKHLSGRRYNIDSLTTEERRKK